MLQNCYAEKIGGLGQILACVLLLCLSTTAITTIAQTATSGISQIIVCSDEV